MSPTAATHAGERYGTLAGEARRRAARRSGHAADATQPGLSKRDYRGLRGSAGAVRAGTRAQRRRAGVQVRQASRLSESRRGARARTVEAIAGEHDSTGHSPPVAGQSALAAPAMHERDATSVILRGKGADEGLSGAWASDGCAGAVPRPGRITHAPVLSRAARSAPRAQARSRGRFAVRGRGPRGLARRAHLRRSACRPERSAWRPSSSSRRCDGLAGSLTRPCNFTRKSGT